MHARRFARALVTHPRDALQPFLHVAVGLLLDLARDVGVSRPAMRRIIFVAAVLRRIVRGRDHDAIGKAVLSALVVGQDRMRDHGRRRIAAALVDHDVDAVGGEYLDRAGERGLRQRMSVDADKQRSGEAGILAIIADRLRRRQDVVFVEGDFQRRTTMARRSERHALRGIGGIRLQGKISGDELWNVRQRVGGDRLAGGGIWSVHVGSFDFQQTIGSIIYIASRRARDTARHSGWRDCARKRRSTSPRAEVFAIQACHERLHGLGAGRLRDYQR